jgi:hypothetical protein
MNNRTAPSAAAERDTTLQGVTLNDHAGSSSDRGT